MSLARWVLANWENTTDSRPALGIMILFVPLAPEVRMVAVWTLPFRRPSNPWEQRPEIPEIPKHGFKP